MRIGTILPAAALLTLSFAWPAEAGHRHTRGCGHGSSYGHRSYGYHHSNPYRAYRYPYYAPPAYGYYGYPGAYRAPYYAPPPVYAPYGYGYGSPYGYGYGYYRNRYRYAPPAVSFHYHGGLRCRRPHVSIHLGF